MKPFVDPHLLQRLRVGPLAPYLDAYLKQIEHDGFLPSSVPMQMYAIARFSKWLRDRQLGLAHVDETTVERFLQRDANIVHSSESASLRRLLALLRCIGITMARVPEPKNCRQRFTDDYRRYLLQERGLAEVTSIIYVGFAEQFLSNRFGNGDVRFAELSATDVTNFVQSAAHQLSSGRATLLVTALRSLLRYMRYQGEISVDLARCVPSVANWSLSTGFAHSITVSTIVRRALINADVDSVRKGAHLFRHTLATDLLRQGVSLEGIGELLRHQSPNTTALYAKVDLTALRTLALPWPGGAR
jgi:site-specific recombinase XerD